MEDKHIVNTKLGKLRGFTRQSEFTGKPYYAFLGIPYAKPPIGDLRFKAPEPFGGWEGIRDALEDGHEPKQPAMIPVPGTDPNKPLGDEDCLVLNVFMNELPKKSGPRKPVMVSIHGGGFNGGSGSLQKFGPDYLLEGDVVLVFFNYRCGAFGFLSLENEEVPGNAGLKDQNLALHWVRDNIDSFGGDPNNVTIFGCSAGGASVNYLLLSTSSKGLFHKAIVQSGFAGNRWAIQHEPLKNAKNLAKELGCTSQNVDDIRQFLKSATADDIIIATQRLSKYQELSDSIVFFFTPCVEVSGKDPFLAEDPDQLTKRGDFNKVPVILGCVQKEGSLIGFFPGVIDNMFQLLNSDRERIVPSCLGLQPGSVEKKKAAKEIWDYYMKGASLSWDNIDDFLKYESDYLFNLGMGYLRTGLLQSSPSPVYTYLFTNHSRCICIIMKRMMSGNLTKTITEETCHGADGLFLATSNWIPIQKPTPEERIAIQKHCKAWTNFASVGDPNCKELGTTWEIDSLDKPCFMDIGSQWTLKEGVPFEDRLAFWKKLTKKYSVSK